MGKITERAWAEVDLSAITHNLRYAQVRIGGSVGVLCVCKADSYGHGAVAVAREVQESGAKAVGVATIEEGVILRQHGVRLPIIIIGSCYDDEVEAAVEHNISLSLSPPDVFLKVAEAAKKLNKIANVHLLIDTGMSRDGVLPEAALELAEQVAETPGVQIEGTYTHLATAWMPDKTYCHEQLGRFKSVISQMLMKNINPGIVHCANSGGIFTLDMSHFDMVRQGITLYGVPPTEQIASNSDLIPALSVKARVMAVKDVPSGKSIGYLREYIAPHDTKSATISMGYADGLRLSMTHGGYFLINGRKVPIIGRVMMDCCVVDVTSVPGVKVGDEVVVIGKSGRNKISPRDISLLCDSSPYEIMCGIGKRVKRHYFRDGHPVNPFEEAELEKLDASKHREQQVRPSAPRKTTRVIESAPEAEAEIEDKGPLNIRRNSTDF